MATNPGKKFEEDFQNSVNREEIFLHRLKDGSTSTIKFTLQSARLITILFRCSAIC